MTKPPSGVIFYDPSGLGGVAQYTYHLAENLALLGSDITVVTESGYELRHLERHFRLEFLFRKSCVTRFLRKLVAFFQPAGQNDRPAITVKPRATAAVPGKKPHSIQQALRRMRVRMLKLSAALSWFRRSSRIVHVQWLSDPNEDYFFLSLLRKIGFKIVYTAHNLLPLDGCLPKEQKVFKRIYELVDKIIVHSEQNKQEMIVLFGIAAEKISVIPIGSYDCFREAGSLDRKTTQEALGILPGKRVLLFFGLIRRYKGLEYLIEAFRQVRSHLDNALLLIVGMVKENTEESEHYTRLIHQLRGREDIMCVPEYVPLERVGAYFAASDLVVLPYVKSYTSAILLAAYAAGRPAVVTDTGGLRETIEEGKSGLVVPPKDSTALANAIIEMFATPDRTVTMGKRAQELAETTYSWKRIASQTLSLYQDLWACERRSPETFRYRELQQRCNHT